MAKRLTAVKKLRGKARMHAEIVEATRGVHKIGAVSGKKTEMITLKMLGKSCFVKGRGLALSDRA